MGVGFRNKQCWENGIWTNPPPPSGPYLLDASVQRKQSENPSQEKRPLGGSDSGAGEAAT